MGKSKVPKARKQRIQNRERVRRHRPRMLQSDLELKRVKNRERYEKKKENGYRQRKQLLAKTAHYLDDNTPPVSDNEVLPRSSSSASSRKLAGRKQNHSFCSINDNIDHQTYAVWAHLNKFLNDLSVELPNINAINFFSDKPTSQYRNRVNIYFLLNKIPEIFKNVQTISWNYSASGHRKGPMDAVGGTLNRDTDRLVLQSLDILSATSFVRNLSKKSKVKLWPVPTSEVEFLKKDVPKKLTVVPNIMNLHQITGSK
ncbi:hypothetical protein ILUMI_18767 [Ignelater luminosus]|uniref:Uncharacterized protein n=1 Tax=Ignelater luminosus TaxID=2038154 RepID=A0A8K0CNK1_IGNLU|nr:hypothetical protein ILUMI_18767 [Ignelater luminosus]